MRAKSKHLLITVALLGAFFIAPAYGQGLLSSDRLVGRDTAGIGQAEQIQAGAGVSFLGTGAIGFDATELGNLTWGSGSGFAWTFDVAGTDISLGFGSNLLNVSGQLVVGSNVNTPKIFDLPGGANTPVMQTMAGDATAGWAASRYSNTATGASFVLGKSRDTIVGLHTIVQSGDTLGNLVFDGSDGVQFIEGGRFTCTVDGTPGTNDMPGACTIATTSDGAADATDRWTVDSVGALKPAADGLYNIGTTTLGVNNIHLDTGATINVENGDWVWTHSAGVGTVSTGDLRVTTAGTNSASVVTVGGTQTLTNKTLTTPTISTGYVASVADGTGIDGTASGNNSTFTPTLDLTEVSSTTWGAGAFTTMTFDAGAIDPLWTYASDTVSLTSAATFKVGTTTSVTNLTAAGATVVPQFQVAGNGGTNSAIGLSRWTADANPGRWFLGKSRGASVGTFTVVQSGDGLGDFVWNGADGTDFAAAAAIKGEVDGTPGGNDMPGRLVFSTTTDGNNNPTDRWTIDATGVFKPFADGSYDIGTTALGVNNQFFDTGAVINFENGDVTLTHSTDLLTVAGGEVRMAAGTATVPPLRFQAGTNLTTAADGAVEMDADVFYHTTDAGNRGVVPARHWVRADATNTLSNVATEQAIFAAANDTITLETGTYYFEGFISLSSMSATSGNASIDPLGAGTATCASWLWYSTAIDGGTGAIGAWQSAVMDTQESPAAIATAGTATTLQVRVKGTVEVTGAGTMIPSVTLANASAAVVAVGSYFTFERVGSTTMTNVGQWN